jgi:uncharacterized membrane protein YdjX (TVP38/TMEM64 family)
VTIVAVTAWLLVSGRLDQFSDWDAMDELLTQLGPWSAVFLISAQIAQVLIPVIPSQLLGMASGALYGVFWGTALSLAGLIVGSWVAIRLARRYGRPFVERHTAAETIDRIDRLAQRSGPWAFFLVALMPFLPTDVGCFVAGLTKLRTRSVLLPIMLGRLPGVLLLNTLGATSTTISLETMVIVTSFTLVVAIVLWHFRGRLEGIAHRWLHEIGID